jgi:hypothetical protein
MFYMGCNLTLIPPAGFTLQEVSVEKSKLEQALKLTTTIPVCSGSSGCALVQPKFATRAAITLRISALAKRSPVHPFGPFKNVNIP